MLLAADVRMVALDVVNGPSATEADRAAAKKAIRRVDAQKATKLEITESCGKKPSRKNFAADADGERFYRVALTSYWDALDRRAVRKHSEKVLNNKTSSPLERRNARARLEAIDGPPPPPQEEPDEKKVSKASFPAREDFGFKSGHDWPEFVASGKEAEFQEALAQWCQTTPPPSDPKVAAFLNALVHRSIAIRRAKTHVGDSKRRKKMSTETMNKFQKAYEARAAKRRQSHGVTKAQALAARDEVRKKWTGHNRPENQTRAGLLLDDKTLAAQADFTASRKPTEPAPAQQMSAATLESITRDWLSRNPGFYNSEFNRVSMRNFLQKNINDNRLTASVEMLDVAFEWLTKNNHLEKPPGTIRRRGEVVSSAVVTLFEYTPPEVQAAIDQEQAARAIDQRAKEDAANRSLSLEQLRQKAHAARGTISREAIRVFQG